MNDDKKIATAALDMQARGKDYGLTVIPGFKDWCSKKSLEGGNEAAIDHMLAMSMYLLPEEVASVTEEDFEEIYEDIVDEIE